MAIAEPRIDLPYAHVTVEHAPRFTPVLTVMRAIMAHLKSEGYTMGRAMISGEMYGLYVAEGRENSAQYVKVIDSNTDFGIQALVVLPQDSTLPYVQFGPLERDNPTVDTKLIQTEASKLEKYLSGTGFTLR